MHLTPRPQDIRISWRGGDSRVRVNATKQIRSLLQRASFTQKELAALIEKNRWSSLLSQVS